MNPTFSGQRLREHRHARHMKRRELAAAIGRSIHTIDSYECGHRIPSATTLYAIAKVFGVGSEVFFIDQPANAGDGGVACRR